jgi:phospholipid/cholesterol/gamma-HCH transport system ATP-binding protein
VRELRIGYDDRVLLDSVSFQVNPAEVFIILGGSGCGKSTLLRHLIHLEEPLAGTVQLAAVAPGEAKPGERVYGVMFQSGALLGSMTVGENVALALETWTKLPPDAVSAMVRAKLRLVGLDGAEDKLPSELSGGMKKRAAIARAMILEPSLLFLDEPSAGLDPITAAELDSLILKLHDSLGTTVVMVTHDLDSIARVGSRCIMLDKETRGIIAEGNPRELAKSSEDPRVQAFFGRTSMEAA